MNIINSTCILLLFFFCVCTNANNTTDEQKAIDQLLPKDYDSQVPPVIDGNPVIVDVKLSVLSLRSLSEQNLCFTADLFVHYIWTDHRINMDPTKPQKIVLRGDWINRIWRPETVFKNGISGEYASNLYKTTYFVINESRQIFQASRITVTLLCDFDFKNYPHDSNVCSIDLMALSYQTSKMVLRLKSLFLSRHLFNNDFTISKEGESTCNGLNEVGAFSCVRSEIRFNRNYGYFLLKTYIPSCIIVLTAIFGFWLASAAYPQRIALYMSAMIALFTMQIQNTSTIKPSYIVSIQIWMTSCVVFVFICLLEFLIASTIDIKNKQLDEAKVKEELSRSQNNLREIEMNETKYATNSVVVIQQTPPTPQILKLVEYPAPEDPKKLNFAKRFKQLWDRKKESIVLRGYTGRRIDNIAKFWITLLYIVWIGVYILLVSTRT